MRNVEEKWYIILPCHFLLSKPVFFDISVSSLFLFFIDSFIPFTGAPKLRHIKSCFSTIRKPICKVLSAAFFPPLPMLLLLSLLH